MDESDTSHSPGRKPQAERREASMTHILDVAEAVFAKHGYGVPLNDVAKAAGVAPALMRYYFGDKEQLFRAVFFRRGPELNAMRLATIDAYAAAAGDHPTLEGFIDAFVKTGFEQIQLNEGHRNYGAIIAYVNSSRGAINQLMSETFDAVSDRLIEEMRRLFPDTPLEDIYWGYHFLTGAFTFSLGQTGRIDEISGGLCRSDDFKAIAERLAPTMAAGLQALFESRRAQRVASE